MRNQRVLGVLASLGLIVAAATGCGTLGGGGSSTRSTHAYRGGGGSQPQATNVAGSYGGGGGGDSEGDSAEATASTSAPTEGGSCCASEPAPRERPGLGTVYGEQRASRIHETTFSRASDSPFATLVAHYNDQTGTRAMVDRMLGRGAAPRYAPDSIGGGIDVSVVNENGSPLPAYIVGGQLYIVGEAGSRYAISVHNRSPQRYEVVTSVDGLDVMDGKRADTSKRGYVVDAYQSFTIEGFRTSYDEVAAFRFGSVGDSYASRTGDDRNVGVIGVALFQEYGDSPWSDDELRRREQATPFAAPPPGR